MIPIAYTGKDMYWSDNKTCNLYAVKGYSEPLKNKKK